MRFHLATLLPLLAICQGAALGPWRHLHHQRHARAAAGADTAALPRYRAGDAQQGAAVASAEVDTSELSRRQSTTSQLDLLEPRDPDETVASPRYRADAPAQQVAAVDASELSRRQNEASPRYQADAPAQQVAAVASSNSEVLDTSELSRRQSEPSPRYKADAQQVEAVASSDMDASELSRRQTITRQVFFHYMVGTITDAHAQQDIIAAKATGADAFALNIGDVTSSWALQACTSLFKWANQYGFKLFFSFDMNSFSSPTQFTSFLKTYITNPAYYKTTGPTGVLPLVSTFNGGAARFATNGQSVSTMWQANLKNVMAANRTPVLFMPAFDDVIPSTSFFSTYPVCDGAMQWESWPYASAGATDVSTQDDTTYKTAAANVRGKKFIMGASPLQFKHLDSSNNYYRRGKGNFNVRLPQTLALQPDMVEFQTWNDVGEGHNLGYAWPEGISCCTNIQAYSVDHSAFLEIMPTWIAALKANTQDVRTLYPSNGLAVQGVFYYHKLLASANCASDPIGKPSGVNLVDDVITVMLYVAPTRIPLRAVINVGRTNLGTFNLTQGYNSIVAARAVAGQPYVQIVDGTGVAKFTGTGTNPILASSTLCNYNIEVVKLVATGK